MNQTNHSVNILIKGILVKLFFLLYILYLIFLTLFSIYYGRGYFHRSINLIPFRTIIEYLSLSYNPYAVMRNILGNIAAFIPMGLLLPMAVKGINSLKRAFSIVLLSTLAIEISQYILGAGTADIDDIILNLLGGIIGFGLYVLFVKKLIALYEDNS